MFFFKLGIRLECVLFCIMCVPIVSIRVHLSDNTILIQSLPFLFFWFSQRRQFLHGLAHNLPSESPLSKDWPSGPRYVRESSNVLRKIYHKWRVRNHFSFKVKYLEARIASHVRTQCVVLAPPFFDGEKINTLGSGKKKRNHRSSY